MRALDGLRGLVGPISAWLWTQVAWQVVLLVLVGLALRVTVGLFSDLGALLRAGGW